MQDVMLDAPAPSDVASACAAAMLAPAIATGFGGVILTLGTGPYALLIGFVAFVCALVLAAPHVFLLGLPTYLLIRRFTAPDWRLSGACGLLLGAAPFLLIAVAGGDDLGDDLPAILILAVMGMIGGLSFHWRLYPRSASFGP
jgi:hypothetical protein